MRETNSFHLLKLIEQQKEIIDTQHKTIKKQTKLIVEQESLINELMRGEVDKCT